MPTPRTAAFGLLAVGLGTLVVPLDSAVNVDFPSIVARFGLAVPAIQWVVISYVLTQTSLMLTFGRIGDIVGYRGVFLTGCGLSAVAFAACALSPGYPALLAGRVVQGVGAGLILSVGPALATRFLPEERRARVLGHYMLVFGLGAALGPSAFGPVVQRFGWASVFACRVPLALAAFVLAWGLPPDRPPASPTASPTPPPAARAEPFDAAGGALLAVATAALLLALNQLRHPLPCLAAAAVAAPAFALFHRQERRAPCPIIDLAQFRQPGFARINAASVLVNLSAFAIMLLAPFYLHDVALLSLPRSGLMLAAAPLGTVLGAPVAGRLAARDPRPVAFAGTAAAALGLLGVSLAGLRPRLAPLAGAMLLQGFGVGLFQVACLEIVTAAVPARQRGVAGALGMATRTIGTVAGATLLMLLFRTVRGPAADAPALVHAFQVTFRCAALLPAALLPFLLPARWPSPSPTAGGPVPPAP